MRKRHRAYNYKFTEKTHSVKGILGLILAVLSMILGIAMIVISFENGGNGTIYLGSGGVLSLLIALTAFALAVVSMKEEERYRLFPMAATITSVLALVCWIGLYVVGILGF